MKQVSLTIPEIGLIAGTRAAGAAGLALLLSNRIDPNQRRAIGWTLLAVGVITTVPLIAQVFGKLQECKSPDGGEVKVKD
ncbi:hypothetical protein K2O51_33390 (plasmid) [Cupriavidus pinatubonensis]|uniref:hypothetical protein n=1 Tax=Cupriavidus pinatubonensis TaxID=248026 RepID=UPI001C73B93C|nr:hypothetical protein [Cupriavidus pinatubonensis]QYY34240.1 hypothetical protein K2O51_33390 [Cupriavidus pinatubonensis]